MPAAEARILSELQKRKNDVGQRRQLEVWEMKCQANCFSETETKTATKMQLALISLDSLSLSNALQWRSQPKNLVGAKKFGVGKMLDFRRITLFFLEKRLSKHKMTIFSENFGWA